MRSESSTKVLARLILLLIAFAVHPVLGLIVLLTIFR